MRQVPERRRPRRRSGPVPLQHGRGPERRRLPAQNFETPISLGSHVKLSPSFPQTGTTPCAGRPWFDSAVCIDDLTLNTSKLHPPAVTTALIVRPRPVEQFQRGLAGPLTLVCAPAGYGKTTLVSACLARSGRRQLPAAWLSIDEQDSELAVFVRYFCAAVRTLFPGSCPHTVSLLNAPSTRHAPPFAALVTALSNELVDLSRAVCARAGRLSRHLRHRRTRAARRAHGGIGRGRCTWL